MNDSIKSSTSTLGKGDTTPAVSDNKDFAEKITALQAEVDLLSDKVYAYSLNPSLIVEESIEYSLTLAQEQLADIAMLNGRAK